MVSMTWGLIKCDLRTMNDLCNLVIDDPYSVINVGHPIVDSLHRVINAGHFIADTGHSFIYTSHPIVDDYHLISNSLHTLANGMRGLQILCNAHPGLLMRQFV